MPILRTLRRYQHTATPDQDRWAIRDDLRATRRALMDGEFGHRSSGRTVCVT
ncbi:MAG: hypothetical protein GXP62_07020 [Oligoflexia bacterium]|nr:hypothetical protein [Oligoflexia bacterium]